MMKVIAKAEANYLGPPTQRLHQIRDWNIDHTLIEVDLGNVVLQHWKAVLDSCYGYKWKVQLNLFLRIVR